MKKLLFALLISIIVFTGTLFAENSWPRLTKAQCENMTTKQIQKYIDTGDNVVARNVDGLTALMAAAYGNSNPEIITVLLEAGADVNARDKEGKNAWVYIKENEALKGTNVYWELNDKRFD